MPHNACRIRNDPKRQYNYYTLSEGKLQKSSKKGMTLWHVYVLKVTV